MIFSQRRFLVSRGQWLKDQVVEPDPGQQGQHHQDAQSPAGQFHEQLHFFIFSLEMCGASCTGY